MSKVIVNYRDLTDKKQFYRIFQPNQSVSITFNTQCTTVTSLQEGSTPGILLSGTQTLQPLSTYELIVLGRSSYNVMLWVYDKTHNQVYHDDICRLSNDDSANHMFITNIHDKHVKVKIGILFEKPAEIGATFSLEAIALVYRDGMVNGLWREFEHENIVIKDKYNLQKKHWQPIMTYLTDG